MALAPDTPLSVRARRDDPNAAMTVQEEVDELKVQHDNLKVYVGTISTGGGAAGPGNTYVFTQTTPSSTWVITHSLNAFPAVTVVDSGGSELLPTITYTNSNVVQIDFAAPTSGKAYLN